MDAQCQQVQIHRFLEPVLSTSSLLILIMSPTRLTITFQIQRTISGTAAGKELVIFHCSDSKQGHSSSVYSVNPASEVWAMPVIIISSTYGFKSVLFSVSLDIQFTRMRQTGRLMLLTHISCSIVWNIALKQLRSLRKMVSALSKIDARPTSSSAVETPSDMGPPSTPESGKRPH